MEVNSESLEILDVIEFTLVDSNKTFHFLGIFPQIQMYPASISKGTIGTFTHKST
jgi:hypothetical protein